MTPVEFPATSIIDPFLATTRTNYQRQPGLATENQMPRAEIGVLRMPHYEVEGQGWVQDRQTDQALVLSSTQHLN